MSAATPEPAKQAPKVVRGVARVDDTAVHPTDDPGHRVRLVLPPGNWKEYDPFLQMAEDWFRAGTFKQHPHRGIETVTFVLEGELAHSDNRGGQGILGPGDAQWMTAGRGIVHSEDAHGPEVHTLQLWINLPAAKKLTEPSYQNLRHADMPLREEPGARLRVFSGVSGGVAATTRNQIPVTMVHIRLEPGATVVQEVPARHNAFLYVIAGSGRFGRDQTVARATQVAWFTRVETDAASEISLQGEEDLRALFWAGPPIREPVVARGPFVMNTVQEIEQAFSDYRAGRF